MSTELRTRLTSVSPGVILLRFTAFAVLWFVLAEGEFRYWGLVLIAVGGATFASLMLTPTSGLGFSLAGWARFIPFFVGQSVLGGVDVALRAVARTPRLAPGYVEVRFRLSEESARVFVANTMSLMPGTLSVRLTGDQLEMHVLDTAMQNVERVREVEAHAARMFRLDLPD
jgi:multicomponent Na+:H+ antiporter subunit E